MDLDRALAAADKRNMPEDPASPPARASKEPRTAPEEMMPAAVPTTPAMDTAVREVHSPPGVTTPMDSKKIRTIGGLSVNTTSFFIVAALTINAAVGGGVYGALSGELLDPDLVAAGRKKERELMDQFGVFSGFPRLRPRERECEASGSKTTSGNKGIAS